MDEETSSEASRARPFLRWAGGKKRLVPEILKLAPKEFTAYHEVFIGGGALFFAMQPPRAYLSDVNAELINAYRVVRDNHIELIIRLQQHEKLHSKEHYLLVRAQAPLSLTPIDRAARTIYLNGACFNGLFRVNSSGQFNVPWDPGRSGAAQEDVIARAHDALTGCELLVRDFRAIEETIKPGSFLYADPPYIPRNATSDFTSYTADKFTYQDQVALRDLALRLKKRGVHVLLSNSGTEAVEKLYEKDFELHKVMARRNINSKASARGEVTEYLIR